MNDDELDFGGSVRSGADGSPPQELADALAEVAAATATGTEASASTIEEIRLALQQLQSGKSLLHWAVQVNQPVDVLAAAIKLGADVNQRDAGGSTALHLAVVKNVAAPIRFLVQHGADVDAVDARGATPLHWAISRGFLISTRTLLELGADATKTDAGGASAFARAAMRPDNSVIDLLVSVGADINAEDAKGHSALSWSISEDQLQAMQNLIKHGADVNRRDKSGGAPLHWAARRDNGGPYLVALLEAGAKEGVSTPDEHGMTALEWADLKGTLTEELRMAFTCAVNTR